MGVSNFFYEGAKVVAGFVKAKTSVPKRPAGKKESPSFAKRVRKLLGK